MVRSTLLKWEILAFNGSPMANVIEFQVDLNIYKDNVKRGIPSLGALPIKDFWSTVFTRMYIQEMS